MTEIVKTVAKEFWIFGLKQALACIFGAYLLLLILLTKYWYPFDGLYRYDFLFLAAIGFQFILLTSRLESPQEALVILCFHIVATGMEVFKTSPDIGSWSYPGSFSLGIGAVPLFAGFMYSAVGSYIARVWRIFDFRFSYYPPIWLTCVLVLLIYANFFTHHYVYDFRYVLLVCTGLLFGPSLICFKIDNVHRRMPLIIGLLLVALFIWIAENLATYAKIWIYPSQTGEWNWVPFSKLIAWFLLMMLSFVLVSLIHRPVIMKKGS